uniref:Protein sax-3 n=1 Tax=Trichobilharzia regenti TaxID=157069 RepID=A0AA85KJW0_TRIRE|nr:unnamed protein product [Trichobilharzia regenti]
MLFLDLRVIVIVHRIQGCYYKAHISMCLSMSMGLCVVASMFVLFILASNGLNSYDLKFIDEPSDVYGLENQQITLGCSAVGSPNISITWHKQDNTSFSQGRSKVIGNTVHSSHSFQLTNDNEGEYYCNASDTFRWILSKQANVRVSFLNEKFNMEPQSKTSNVGDTVLLECAPPYGLPNPTVEWLKDNSTLLPDNRLQLLDGGSLRIDRITWQDAGYYTCVAKSFAHRRESAKAYLTVRQRPFFIISPKSQSVPVHSVFELSCRAAGEPPPVVIWRREPSLPSIPYSRVRLLLGGTLRFIGVQTNDSGYYVCRAVSSTGVVEAVAYINVVSPPGLVVTPPSKLYTYEGNRVELFCSVVGSPLPDVRWLQWSTKKYFIPSVGESERIHVTGSGSLIILAARPEDTSTYECRASSPVGLTRSLTDVQVQFNPKLIPGRVGAVSNSYIFGELFSKPTPVRIVCGVPLDPVFISLHGAQSISKSSEINMRPHLIWQHNGELVPISRSSNSRVSIETDGSLLLYPFKPDDIGNYTCSVYSKVSHRFAQYTFVLGLRESNGSNYQPRTIKQLPSPPTDVKILSVSDTWMVLKWSDNNSSESSSYRVYILPQIHSSSTVAVQGLERLEDNQVIEERITPSKGESPNRKAFKLDNWLVAVEKTYLTQIRITGLLPDTGYWVEVRKVNDFGMSAGNLLPNLVYTMRKPSEVKFVFPSKTNETISDISLKHPDTLFSGSQTAVDFQELVSTFQSIDLHRISVRTLSSSELLVSWTARASNEVLKRIDGFRLNVRSVPMSRCIAAVTSQPPSYSSVHRSVEEHGSLDVYDSDNNDFSLTSSIHCSFTSSKLLEQTVLMANTNSLHANNKDMLSLRETEPDTQSIIISQSVSRDYPNAKAVVGNLSPFSCYEIDIEAFKDDSTYGRILSRSSRSELALTLDAPPSFSPQLISAEWIFQVNPPSDDYMSQGRSTNYSHSPDGIRLSWRPLELRVANGAILGYTLHILANESQFSRSLHVSADVHSKSIQGLNPFVDYVIYISGVNCRGEGVRGPGYHLRSVVTGLQSPTTKSSDYEINILEHFTFPLWAYILLFGFIIFWIIFGLLIHFVVRQTSRKQCFKSPNHYFTTTSHIDIQHGKSVQSDALRELKFGLCCTSSTIRKNKSENIRSNVEKTMGVVLMSNRPQDPETGHLLHRLDSSQSKMYNDKLASESRSVQIRTASGKNEHTSECGHTLSQPFECNSRTLTCNGDVEVYSSNEPYISANMNHLPSAVMKVTTTASSSSNATVPSHNSLMEENLSDETHSGGRPKLPDSINIPFPVPPNCQSNLAYQSNLLSLSNSSNLLISPEVYSGNQLDESEDQRNFTSGDTVPAYASCSVFSVRKTEADEHRKPSGIVLMRDSGNLRMEMEENSQPGFSSNSFSLGDHLNPLESQESMNANQLTVSNCNWQFIPHTLNSPIIIREEKRRQNTIPPPPEYPPPPLPSNSSKFTDLPNLWIPNPTTGDGLQRGELKDHHQQQQQHQLRFVSDDSSLPSGGTYLSNCYSPASAAAYAETHYVSCTISNPNVGGFRGVGSCIVNNTANNLYELSPTNHSKTYLLPNDQNATEFRESTTCCSSANGGVHRLSPLGGNSYPNTSSVIANPGQFPPHIRVKNSQPFIDGSSNKMIAGSSSSGLSGTSGLGSTAIGSGSANFPGYPRPGDSHAM